MSKLTDAVELIRELTELLEASSLSEIEVEGEEVRVRVVRQVAAATVVAPPVQAPPAPPPPAASPAAATAEPAQAGEEAAQEGMVTSPMVGTAYVAPEPGAPPFVKVGDTVKEGDTLLIVEAMKVMNPIPAPRAGTVTRILVSDAQPVEFGEPLMVIE
ncbi:MAG: acetyl-CoA carboxylase biotin carboxyl carrier protein [Alphaproteobacteria bacterium]|nr:MAG: acetyl-CoA carboxylase biotin carboxyl carrier protein [Alphaproteobacteria bacterium]